MPGGSKVVRNPRNLDQVLEHDDERMGTRPSDKSAAPTGLRKSRNHNSTSNIHKTHNTTQHGSTVVYGTGTSINKTQTKVAAKKTSTAGSSVASSQVISAQKGSQKSQSKGGSSNKKGDFNAKGGSKNITNEIKDLLDKLVNYQGAGSASSMNGESIHNHSDSICNTTPLPQHSNSIAIPAQYPIGGGYTSRQKNPISTDSLVELRSSASSSVYIMGGGEVNFKMPNSYRQPKDVPPLAKKPSKN